MNRIDVSNRLANMLQESRNDANKSQDFMARALGVSKKTVQNWESGLSSPTQIVTIEWFSILNLQPFPYLLKLYYPNEFEKLNGKSENSEIDTALYQAVKVLPYEQKRKLLYILIGSHGSSVKGIIEMITAHLHAPLRERINVALSVATNYKIATVHKLDVAPENIQPDIEYLEQSIFNALDAVYSNKQSYTD